MLNLQTSPCSSIICKIEAQILPTDVFFSWVFCKQNRRFYKREDTHLDITDYTQMHTTFKQSTLLFGVEGFS